jgi:hypothetical protein
MKPIAVFLILGAIIVAILGLAALLRRYLEVGGGRAVLISLLSLLAGAGAGFIRFQEREAATPMSRWVRSRDLESMPSLCAALLTALAVIFLVKLHSKWIAGRLADAEKKPGLEGARAWLGAGNIICVILLSLLAWLSFDYSPCAVALLGLLALLSYPAINAASVHFRATPLPPESSAPERQRVLNMLDSGKIIASEAAELLSALNYSEKPRAAKAAAPPQRLALIGALRSLIGFFLPWFSIHPQSEVNSVAQGLPIDPNWMQFSPLGHLNNIVTIRIFGGDVGHGLGWLVLALGVAAAALPYFAGHVQEQARQRAILAALGVGAVILLYLVTHNLRFVSIGIFLAVTGYGLQLAGALREGRFSGHGAV